MNEPPPLTTAILAAGTISSPANPRVRGAARLREAATRRETGLTLVDGLREIGRCLAAGVDVVEAFVSVESLVRSAEPEASPLGMLLGDLSARGIPLAPLTERPFGRVAFGDRNEGLVAVVRFRGSTLDAFQPRPGRPIFLLEGIEKPGNLGAILRSADAAGLGGVILCGGGTDSANPAVIRASLGTVFSLPLAIATTPAVIDWCRQQARPVIAATPEGRGRWHEADLGPTAAILLGSEAHGISPAWTAAAAAGQLPFSTVTLPMLGVADSLNVSATAAVLAYESLRQRQASG